MQASGLRPTQSDAGVRVGGLQQLGALAADHPQRIGLGGAFGVQQNHLELAEVCRLDVAVERTGIERVGNVVVVKVVETGVSAAIAWHPISHLASANSPM